MKKRTKTSLIWALGGGVCCLLVGLMFSLSCFSGGGVSYLSGLCVVPILFGAMAAVLVGLLLFLLTYAFYPLLKKAQTKDVSTSDLLTNPKAFETWQKKVEKMGA